MLRFSGALIALACFADAGVIKRQISPPISMSMRSETGNFSQTISEANDLTVSFYLNEPIMCPPEDQQCRVVILLHNSRPDELVLSSCHVIWNHYDSYLEPRNVTISTVENFIDDGQRRFHIGTQVNSSTALYRDFPLPEIIIHTEPKNVATCSSTTDPNYRQFDGGNFVINTAGTFQLWRAPLRDWEVQSRVNPSGFNCGVALRDGCDRYVVDRCSGTLVMRQYPGGSSDGLAPRVTRENGDTYVFTSQRAGAVVRVRERIRINRHGRSICGWSGCRVVYHTTRTEWLDITMTAPGRDWGFIDNTETPRTSGVCGHYDGVTMAQGDTDDCHVAGAVASNSAACAPFVSNHRVQGTNLFDATPTPCATPRPPVVHNYDMCEMPPRPIQRPVLQTHDIEEWTEIMLREQPEDRGDERINYDFEFEGQPFTPPARPDGFSEAAMVYCRDALLDTQAARLCEALNVDVEVFVTNCHNDMMFQANNSAFTPGARTDDRHEQLAAAQLEEMQSTCITDAIRRRQNIQLTCDDQADCEVACVEQDSGDCVNTCIGDCRISFNNTDLESLVDSECPNNCGNGFAVNGTVPGRCVRNAEGRNVCACSEGFAGNDCSIMTAELPISTRLFPFVCDIVGGACPQNIAVEGEEYYRTDTVACRVVDGDETHEMNATVISSTIIRCEMPDIVHSGAAVKTVQVSITLDGEIFSEPLPFMYRDQRCRNCTRTGDCNIRVSHTCIIDNACHMHEQVNPSNPDCQVCDSAAHPFGWSFQYTAAQCGPTIRQIGTTVRIQENQQVGQEIQHAGVLPFRLLANPYTDADTVTRTLWSLANGNHSMFSVANSGSLSLLQPVNYEDQRTFSFTLTASRGGLNHSLVVNLEVVNVDEEAVFSNLPYSAQIEENSLDDNLLTVLATDPDGADTAYGIISYSLRSMSVDDSALQHFAINPTTGVVRITDTLNYEDGARRHFQVAATTGAGSTITQAVEVTVLNVNEAPTSIRLSQIDDASRPAMTLTESMTLGDVVGQLTVVDPDRTDTHELELLDDAGGRFRINALNHQLEVASAAGFDYESLASGANRFFTVTVRATDQDSESYEQELLLTITDGNDAPQAIALFGYNPATLSATSTPLVSIPEDQPLGVVGIFTVEDQDTEQTHTFTIDAPDSQSPFRIVGNELRLVRPLNFEDIETYALRVFATDNGEPAMRSATQDFGIAVGDMPDLPGYFQFIAAAGAAGVSELSAVDVVIGTVSGLDQDLVQNFEIHLGDGSTGVAIGATTCFEDADDYTNCSAPVTLTAPIDYESNRVSATASVLLFTVQATDGGGAGVGTGELYMPIINGNDRPSGVLVESLIPGVGPATMATAFQIEEGQTSLPRVARLHASDADDSCPAGLEGCQSFTATGAYSFDLVAQSSTYRLGAECAERRTVASRMASGRHCELVLANANAAVTAGQGSETVTIRVTDQTGLSVVQSVAVTVVAPVVRLGVTFDSVSESVVHTSGTVVASGSLGELVLSGWTESTAPSVTLTGAAADLFVLSSADGRRRDAARSLTWSVAVAPGANIDFETMPTVNFSVAVAAVGDDFAGLGFWTSLAVTDVVETWRSVVCVSGACLPASEQNVRLHDDAAAGTAVATLQFANPEDVSTVATPFWHITRTVPSTTTNPIFQINQDTGVITTTRTADEAALENGAIAIDVSVVDSSAPVSRPRSDRFTVTVTIYDDCSNRTCSMEGECRDQVNAYACVCNLGRGGRNCEQILVESVEAGAMEGDNEASSAGTVVGVVLGLLFAILLVVGVVLFMREKQAKDRMVMSQIRSQASVNPTYETMDEIVQGVSNPMYAWYKPGMSKQSAYQDLATAQPGTFVIRDGISSLDNPMYCLHVKTPQALIKDVSINGTAGEVALVGHGANQPGFDTLVQLVDYYSNPTDQPFVLSTATLVAPISGMDIYDNALITNKRVDTQGPLVPKKMINYKL